MRLQKAPDAWGMVAGQVADIESEDKACSREMLDYIHLTKTAALIVAAVRAGAQLGGADAETLNNLTIYAENLGLAFQIADDILDVVGSEKEMGKKAGVDQVKKKSTYPSLYGLEASKAKLMELTDNAIEALSSYYDNAELFTKLATDLTSTRQISMKKLLEYQFPQDLKTMTENEFGDFYPMRIGIS